MIQGPIQQEDVKILKPYAFNNTISNIYKQNMTECKAEIDKITIRVGDFNISLSK